MCGGEACAAAVIEPPVTLSFVLEPAWMATSLVSTVTFSSVSSTFEPSETRSDLPFNFASWIRILQLWPARRMTPAPS